MAASGGEQEWAGSREADASRPAARFVSGVPRGDRVLGPSATRMVPPCRLMREVVAWATSGEAGNDSCCEGSSRAYRTHQGTCVVFPIHREDIRTPCRRVAAARPGSTSRQAHGFGVNPEEGAWDGPRSRQRDRRPCAVHGGKVVDVGRRRGGAGSHATRPIGAVRFGHSRIGPRCQRACKRTHQGRRRVASRGSNRRTARDSVGAPFAHP